MGSSQKPRKPTVLVVEDEPILLIHAMTIVEEAGLEAVAAANADDAVAILLSRPDIRIVFTDISMPGSMNGLRLAAMVRDRWPPIEIIICSAFAAPNERDLPPRGVFFSKPYDDAVITAALLRFAA